MITEQEIKDYNDKLESEKKNWPDGKWKEEPNRKNWKKNGLECMILRNSGGAWCGYVGVKKNHPFFGLDYSHPSLSEIVSHGGLTYASECRGNICHISDDDSSTWWFGFDCAHFGDIVPAFNKHKSFDYLPQETYKDMDYAVQETNYLSKQLSKHVG